MKYVLGFLFFLGYTTTAYAQGFNEMNLDNRGTSPDRTFRRVIPQAGIILSDYVGNDSAHYVNKNGFSGGALVDIGSWYHLVGETGLLYRQLNASNENTFGVTNYTNSYISVPAAAKYYFAGQENTSFYAKLGIMGSTLTSSNSSYSPGYAGTVYSTGGREFELSALGGVGGKFFLSQDTDLILEGVYTRATDSAFSNTNVYNAAWNFSAGVSVNL